MHPSFDIAVATAGLILAVALLGAIGAVSPQQLPMVLYKASLITLAAVLGYWLDRQLFLYSRPDGYLHRDWRYGTDEPEGDVDYPVVQSYIRVAGDLRQVPGRQLRRPGPPVRHDNERHP